MAWTRKKRAPFAANCLLARRMVERGVRFVHLVHGSWDDHSEINHWLDVNCGMTDRPAAALIADLKQRGLLDETLVVWAGEFGRTPMGEVRRGSAAGKEGRDHHPFAFSLWMAGGGVKRGYVHGADDEFGYNVVDRPVHVHDLQATLLHLLGIDHERLTYRHAGRDFRLTDVAGKVVHGADRMNRPPSRRRCRSRRVAPPLSGCFGRGRAGPRRVRSSPRRRTAKIQIHRHPHASRRVSRRPQRHRQGLLDWMDQHDVERAVILPLVSPEAAPVLEPMQTSEAAIEAAAAHPDRLIAFCCLDPRVTTTNPARYGHVGGVDGIIEILKRYKDAGARGLGEHKVGLPFDHPQMMQLYQACDRLELPILFHLDDLRGIDTPGLPRLENVLKAFPKLPLIGHACGFWSSISGDATGSDFGRYPTPPRPITPGGALDRLMDAYPNLYGDISEPGGAIALTRDPVFAREFVLRRADRLLFGSDYLAPEQQMPSLKSWRR